MKGQVGGDMIEVGERSGRRGAQGKDAGASFEERADALAGSGWKEKSRKKLIINQTGLIGGLSQEIRRGNFT